MAANPAHAERSSTGLRMSGLRSAESKHALRAQVRAFVAEVWQEHREGGRVWLALTLGCAIGATPLFGFHLALCIAVAWLFGLNQVITYGAANISLPPLIPFVGIASIAVGEKLLHHRVVLLHRSDFRSTFDLAARFFVSWLVGGLLFGAAIGFVSGGGIYLALRRRTPAILLAASRLYRGAAPQLRWYAWFKYRLDPCYRAVLDHIPPDSFTVDVGTGLGMLPVAIALKGQCRRALGFDWDETKLNAGKSAAAKLDGVILRSGDARSYKLPACDVITLIDVLHYYDAETQRQILDRCARALRPGGKLLIRETDATCGGGASFTRAVEKIARRVGWNRGPATHFRRAEDLAADLSVLGLVVGTETAAFSLQPGNLLLIGTIASAPAVSCYSSDRMPHP